MTSQICREVDYCVILLNMDSREDELDYGEEEPEEDPNAVPSSFHASPEEEEMLPDDDYEDLYDDVNIAYFEPSVAEISKKTQVDGGEVFEGDFEAYPSAAGREIDGDKPEALQTPPDFSQLGPEEVQTSPSAGIRKKQQAIRPFSHTQTEKEGTDDLENQELGLASSAQIPSKSLEEAQKYGLEGQHKADSVVAATISQGGPPEKKGSEVAWTSERASVPLRANVSVRNGLGQTALTHTTLSPQERVVEGKGPEASAGTGHTGNGKEHEGNISADEISTGGATKMARSVNASGKGAGRLADEGGARLSHGGGNRETSSTTANDHLTRHGGQAHTAEGGRGTMLFVGELHWWTTDAEIEASLAEFGSVKSVKFFEERASGKSKGYCQVEFYEHSAAAACKEGMNGRRFHGRPCLVAFANPRIVMQMGTAQVNKAQAQLQAQQAQTQSRRMINDGSGSNRGPPSYHGGENARGYGRMTTGGRSGHGQGISGRGGHNGPGRARGNMGSKGISGGAAYGQGFTPMGSHPSGMIMPQGMMGQAYDPGYGPPMGRGGASYGGYVIPGPPFSGLVPQFPSLGPGAFTGVAPHVNPAFFRNATANGMGMVAGNGMDASLSGLWGDGNLSGWGAEENDRRAREANYGDDIGGADYGYGSEMGYEKGRVSGGREKERDRNTDGDWSERRRWDDRDGEREGHREREGYGDERERDRELGKDDDWEREKQTKTRNRIRMVEDDEDEEQHHGKRRRPGGERYAVP